MALGQGSIADEENTLSVGSDGSERRITNVAAGVNDTDAVNMSQLNAVQNQVSTNASNIAANTSAINRNASKIATHTTKIASNSADIAIIKAQSAILSSSESASASSSGSNSLALGSGASAHDDDTAIGANATVTADSSTAVGSNTLIESEQAVAVGADATVSSEATGGVAIGQNAVVEQGASNAVALGQGSIADEANTVSVGSSDNQRRVTNVADGENNGDAVNVGQLNTVKSDVSSNSAAIESEAETRAASDEAQQEGISANSSAITEVRQTLNDTRDAVAHLDRRVDQLENEMDEVAALASAFSALVPNARSASNTQLSLGLGNYGNANAVALGVFHYVNDNVLVNVGASTAFGNSKTAARAGITIGF